jgi:hypothetical protein
VWLVFGLSMLVFSASMLTLHEGRRFVSRRLTAQEIRIVQASLALWEGALQKQDVARLRTMLAANDLLAMDSLTFARPEERGTFGYSDEHGRILLNPNLCFANHRMAGERTAGMDDEVATMCTLYHETRHLLHGATEAVAYEDEWQFARCARRWACRRGMSGLAGDLAEWEMEMPGRIRLYVGEAVLQKIRARVGKRVAAGDSGQAASAPR